MFYVSQKLQLMKKLFTFTFFFILLASYTKAQNGTAAKGDDQAAAAGSQNQATAPSGVVTGIQNIENEGGPGTIFPNPAVGEFNINANGPSTIILFNDIMQHAMEMQLNPGANHIQSSLATGVYYYIIHSSSGQSGGHLVIQ